MLYYLHEWRELFSPLRIFQYITFRAFCAAGTAFLISILTGPWMIRKLRQYKIGQQIRKSEAPPLYQFHGKKEGTPTMGGLLIIVSALVGTLLWVDLSNVFVHMTLGTMVFMGGVGFLDDAIKLKKKRSKGLGAKSKLALQALWAILIISVLWHDPEIRYLASDVMVPFLKNPLFTGLSFSVSLIFLMIVILGATNAVNLTDGLDGLAVGCSNSVALSYLVMSYLTGHMVFADYLNIPYVAGAGELTVFCGALLGSGLGFLWFNCHPARVFMGDTGSLALGGSIAMIAILIQQELLLIIVGGVFTMEALSVLMQVTYFRLTGGRRIFKCSPIHHHFELVEKDKAEREGRDLEVVETMITTRFWILSIIFALVGVATLKIR